MQINEKQRVAAEIHRLGDCTRAHPHENQEECLYQAILKLMGEKANGTGLTADELQVMTDIKALAVSYKKLPVQHPYDSTAVASAINSLFAVMALRAARKAFPESWPTYEAKDGKWVQK